MKSSDGMSRQKEAAMSDFSYEYLIRVPGRGWWGETLQDALIKAREANPDGMRFTAFRVKFRWCDRLHGRVEVERHEVPLPPSPIQGDPSCRTCHGTGEVMERHGVGMWEPLMCECVMGEEA